MISPLGWFFLALVITARNSSALIRFSGSCARRQRLICSVPSLTHQRVPGAAGPMVVGRRWLDAALDAAGPGADPRCRAEALDAAGELARLQADHDATLAYQQSLEIWGALGAAAALREEIGAPTPKSDVHRIASAAAATELVIGAEQFAKGRAVGAAMSYDESWTTPPPRARNLPNSCGRPPRARAPAPLGRPDAGVEPRCPGPSSARRWCSIPSRGPTLGLVAGLSEGTETLPA
jgi:hypothetical protein